MKIIVNDIPADIKERWACPSCKSNQLSLNHNRVQCGHCQSVFDIQMGIPLFAPKDSETIRPYTHDLTILILALNEEENLKTLLSDIATIIRNLKISHQIIVIDGGSTDKTAEVAMQLGVQVIHQKIKGYGKALVEGFEASTGRIIITMDSDLSHPAECIARLWSHRDQSELIIASRYVPGASFEAPMGRKVLSLILNRLYKRVLALPCNDLSSGFRLYHHEALHGIKIKGTHFETLEEILARVYMAGWRISEIPFDYHPRKAGQSKARLILFGLRLLKMLFSMWSLRNSIASADYDERAFDSPIPLQRYWQRKRHRIITEWAGKIDGPILDIGCGSSKIIQDLKNSIGMDILISKLRYLRARCPALVQGSIFSLPFQDQTFSGVVCSQVIEHIPADDIVFKEMARVLKPGGLLILGTPDYERPYWPVIEWFYKHFHPNGYGDEHITQYGLSSLKDKLEIAGFHFIQHDTILKAELNILAQKK